MNASKPMPTRGHTAAPKFDGDAKLLNRYFEDVEQLCLTHEIEDVASIIKWCTYYVAQEEEDTFKAIDATLRDTFDHFKEAVRKEYPGSDDERKYTLEDLALLAAEYRAKASWTREDVGTYYRGFKTRSAYLISKNRYSAGDRNRLFLTGFPTELRTEMKTRLMTKEPDVHPEDGYDIDTVRDAAIYAVAGIVAEASATAMPLGASVTPAPRVTTTASPPPVTSPGISVPVIKTEPADRATMLSLIEELRAQGVIPNPQQVASSMASRYPASGRGPCNFCGAPGHRIRECPDVQGYITAKKLVREDRTGMLAMPDGSRFPSYLPGTTMKEKVDRYYADGGAAGPLTRDVPPHMASMNLYEIHEPVELAWFDPEPLHHDMGSMLSFEVAEDENDDGPAEPMSSFAEQVADLYTMLDTAKVQILALQNQVSDGRPSVRFDPNVKVGPPRGIRKTAPGPDKAKTSAPTPPSTYGPPPSLSTPKPAGIGADGPYRLQAPVEDVAFEAAAVEQVLGTQITLNLQTLLGLAPSVRKNLKDLCTAKRVPMSVNYVETPDEEPQRRGSLVLQFEGSTEPDDPDARIVAADTLPLRVVWPTVGGTARPECVLDPGSQIVAMRKDIWQRIGAALDPTKKTPMQSANNTINHTLGVIRSLTFEFDGVVLPLQVHVVENAPFEVLLGRPFFALSKCNTKDYIQGEQQVTLTDPNTGQIVTVPTSERQSPRRRRSGF